MAVAALGDSPYRSTLEALSFADGRRLLDEHTVALLGTPPELRFTHIMVTMPSEAATDYELVHELIAAGMSCARINCAHDDSTTLSVASNAWQRCRRNCYGCVKLHTCR